MASNKCKIVYSGGVAGVFDSDGSPSRLFDEALNYYGNQEEAIDTWQIAYTKEYNDLTGKKVENSSLNDVLSFLSNNSIQSDKLSSEELGQLRQIMTTNSISTLEELTNKLNRIFKRDGYFEVSTKRLVESGLYNQEEAEGLDTDKILSTLNKITGANFTTDIQVVQTSPQKVTIKNLEGEKTILGTFKETSVEDIAEYIALNSPTKTPTDIQETVANSEDFAYVADKMSDSPALSNLITSMVQSKMRVKKVFLDGGIITEQNQSEKSTVKNTLLSNIDPIELSADIEFLEGISSEIWLENKDRIKRVIKEIEKSLIKNNIDLIGLSDLAEFDREGTLVTLESAYEMLLNPNNDTINRYVDVKAEVFGNKSPYVVIDYNPTFENLNVVHLESTLSDAELFDRFGLLKVADNVYHVTDINIQDGYKVLYEQVLNGELIIPKNLFYVNDITDPSEKVSVMSSISNYINSRDIGISGINNTEAASMAQVLFGYNSPQKNATPTTNVDSENYLTTEFVTDFYQYTLEEKYKGSDVYDKVLKHFYVSDTDINLNSFSTPDITGIKYENELREYATIKKEGQIRQLSNQKQQSADYDLEILNNPNLVKELSDSNFKTDGTFLSTPVSSDMYKRVGSKIFRKVYSELGRGDVFRAINLPVDNTYFTTNLNFETDLREAKAYLDASTIPTVKNISTEELEKSSKISNIVDRKKSIAKMNRSLSEIEIKDIEDYAREIATGNAVLKRFSQGEYEAVRRAGEAYAAAALITQRVRGTSEDAPAGWESQAEEILENYAKENNLWVDLISKGEPDAIGEESYVWYNDNGIVTKAKSPILQEGLDFLLDSIVVNNRMFPATASKVIGFSRDRYGEFHIVLEQPMIRAERGATKEEVIDYMENLGFRVTGSYVNLVFANEDYVLGDLHKGNALMSANGDIFVIDSLAYINTPFQRQKGNRSVSDDTIEFVNADQLNSEVFSNTQDQKLNTYQAIANSGIELEELYKPSEEEQVLDKFDECRI